MSKIDAQRAMWKQRYERRQAAAAAQPTSAAPPPPVAPPASLSPSQRTSLTEAPVPMAEPTGADKAEPAEELCGHRNMGGRTCTRERGHAAKSHRYS
jgi:hypothetical protein